MRHRSAAILFGILTLIGAQALRAQGAGTPISWKDTIRGSEPYREAIRKYLNKEKAKIIGGLLAPDGKFPWQVSLQIARIPDPYYKHFCGGSVYSRTVVITAAHCVVGNARADLQVAAGTNVIGQGNTSQIRAIYVHPRFDSTTFDNDIALVVLSTAFPLGARIQPLSLITDKELNEILPGRESVALGWGVTQESDREAVRDLRYAMLPVVDTAECNRPFSNNGAVTQNMLCAGFRDGHADICQGDSGGALTVGDDAMARQIGIVSWHRGCGRPFKYSIYTRISNYTDWITACVARRETCSTPLAHKQ